MTGREKMEAAFSRDGTPQIPAVICYEGIYIRDRWHELSSFPWWRREDVDLENQRAWRDEVIRKLGQDWFQLPHCATTEDRAQTSVIQRDDGVFRVDQRTGEEVELLEPAIGGWSPDGGMHSHHPDDCPETPEEIDACLELPGASEWVDPTTDGRGDLAARLLEAHGSQVLPTASVSAPLWDCYDLWGFEGIMTRIATHPELVEYACQRHVELAVQSVRDAAAIGVAAIWIEECFTDMMSPGDFARINAPAVRQVVEAVREAGMKSVYYYCGDPTGKWERLLDVGADALSLEESKKRFTIDIDDVVDRVNGRCAVLGNLDSIGVLQDGSETDLRAEISRQIAAGRRHGSRFIMSLGSPVTPGTPVARVRQYCDLAHERGAK